VLDIAYLHRERRYLPSLPLAFRIARFFELPVDKIFDPSDEKAGT
jgi:DNA-binding XRE family transcriptional regulator